MSKDKIIEEMKELLKMKDTMIEQLNADNMRLRSYKLVINPAPISPWIHPQPQYPWYQPLIITTLQNGNSVTSAFSSTPESTSDILLRFT